MFTYNEILRMFQEAGYVAESLSSILAAPNDRQNVLIDNLLMLGKNVDRFMYETFHYIIKVRL